MKLAGKVAIVTGAGSGIGRASSLLFAREGAQIVAVDIEAEAVRSLASEIAGTSEAIACVADVSKRANVETVVRTALEHFGRIDILFNNAGVVPQGTVDQIDESEWDRTMAVNVKSMYLFCHEIVPEMKRRGGGVILNTASATALRGVPDRACYTASKGAVVALTRSMALDHVRDNIRVNCLCPGTVETPSLQRRLAASGDAEEARNRFIARQPMGRFGTAEEVAEAALYLVSPQAAFVTGLAFAIDGGLSL